MDKQIIIDGVDVSGCEYYQIEANELYPKANYCGSMRNTYCEIEPNCYYKQLKRTESKLACKEQECERLKAEYTRVHTQLAAQEAYMLVDGEEVWSGATRKLKQENEKLKAENDELKYKAEFFENYNNAHINKITKLEKTLTEIKEITTKMEYGNDFDYDFTWGEQILQKISECEGNDE